MKSSMPILAICLSGGRAKYQRWHLRRRCWFDDKSDGTIANLSQPETDAIPGWKIGQKPQDAQDRRSFLPPVVLQWRLSSTATTRPGKKRGHLCFSASSRQSYSSKTCPPVWRFIGTRLGL